MYGTTDHIERARRQTCRMFNALGAALPQIGEEDLQTYLDRHEGTLVSIDMLYIFWYIALEDHHLMEANKAADRMAHHQKTIKEMTGRG